MLVVLVRYQQTRRWAIYRCESRYMQVCRHSYFVGRRGLLYEHKVLRLFGGPKEGVPLLLTLRSASPLLAQEGEQSCLNQAKLVGESGPLSAATLGACRECLKQLGLVVGT